MWEHTYVEDGGTGLSEHLLVDGSSKTAIHLRSLSKSAILNSDVPLCLASAWNYKSRRLCLNKEPVSDAKRLDCQNCGISLMNRKTLKMDITLDGKGSRKLFAVCRGCDNRHHCGNLLPIGVTKKTKASLDQSMNASCISLPPSTVSTPVIKSSLCTPASAHRVIQLPKSNSKKGNKRRGSALEKLLKEDDKNADRSLSGFLSAFSTP